MMDTASKILIVGGVANITAAFFVGIALAGRRKNEPIGPNRLLLVVHQVALMQGSMLLALTLAVALSDLSSGLETTAAALMVSASLSNGLGNLLNWTGRVEDQFAGKSVGLRLNVLNSLLATPGILILLAGILQAL